MQKTNFERKNTLKNQVKQILTNKGYNFLFNDFDFQYYSKKIKTSFNKAFDIAESIILENNNPKSDFDGYIF